MLVPPHVEYRHSKRSLATVLGVGLLDVAQPTHQLLAGDGLAVVVLVPDIRKRMVRLARAKRDPRT